MRTRLFVRTTEFLWQEGHTVHATEPEAEIEARKMLDVYADVAENEMALPVIRGVKSDAEKFAGALRTYCIEALMGDGKALQAGTSHHLWQKFTKAFDVKYQDKNNEWQHCWSTSWGVSTRLIGAIIMAHGDDQGLNLPPRLAPIQAVIIPIYKQDDEKAPVMVAAENLRKILVAAGIRAHLDDRDEQPGWKYADWELRGIPLRLELGPKDLAKNSVMAVRRLKNDDGTRAKSFLPMEGIAAAVQAQLDEIQKMLFNRALQFRERMTVKVDDLAAFNPRLDGEGGFLLSHWCGAAACEAKVKEETKATIRVISFDAQDEPGKCIACGGASPRRAHFARAY
jgi:prolyl-tRNA synthetase